MSQYLDTQTAPRFSRGQAFSVTLPVLGPAMNRAPFEPPNKISGFCCLRQIIDMERKRNIRPICDRMTKRWNSKNDRSFGRGSLLRGRGPPRITIAFVKQGLGERGSWPAQPSCVSENNQSIRNRLLNRVPALPPSPLPSFHV